MSKIIIKELHIHNFARDEVVKYFKRAELLQGRIMVTVNELAASLKTINDQLAKSKSEIVARVNALEDALKNTEIPAEAQAALDELKGTAKALDDLNPDAPVAPVDEPIVEEPASGEPAPADEPVAPADQPA